MMMRKKDPRHEQSVFLRRQSVRRRRDWKRKLMQVEHALVSVAIVLAGIACLYGLYLVVFTGDTFAVKRIVIEGEWRNLSAEGLAELSGVKEGDNLFWVSVSRIHDRLSLDPWVKATAVRRRLPDTLWVYVEEHKPVALMSTSSGFRYVDSDGVPFKDAEVSDDRDLPVITGLFETPGGEITDEAVGRAREMIGLMELFCGTGFGRAQDVAEIHYDEVEGYSIITRERPMQILFGQADLAERVASLERMREAIEGRGMRIQYMLANEPGRVTVRYQTI
ncbi:MAG TPA: FtsQ-type POTRA domain-containing protein [bacterium]|nr:FtsQ-type POTRA domain-containing protein [bacterium]